MSKDLLGEVAGAVIREMQDSVLLCSWADYSDEHGLTIPGGNYKDNMPNMIPSAFRTEAYELAEQMYEAIKRKWQQETQQVYVEPWACLFAWVINNGELERFDQHLKRWSHDAVMSAIGSGAFWEDSHTPLQVRKADGELVDVEIHGLNFEIPEWDE